MAADWEEIRRLAADFQRAQFADTVQRLSERNCIEIVAKLIEDKQLDVVHTLDGKEYITPAQISREIRDELYIRGGRVNIVDLQQVINVDLVHVESRANDIAKSDRNTQLVLGQLIDETYLDRLAEEVNDKLQEVGQVHVAELCKTYDLPGDFLTEVLSQRLGRIIQGQMDEYNRGVIFTQTFIARHRAQICGLFSAMTRPTQLNHLINLYGFQEHLLYLSRLDCLTGSWEGAKTWTAGGVPKDQIPVTCCVLGLEASFPELCFPVRLKFSRVELTLLEKPPCNHAVLEELVNSSRLRGSVVGGRQDKAVFIPDIYSKTQSSWVDSFLEQNRYLEFDALNRLGIPDPVGYIKKRFRGRKLLFLQASCVDQAIIQQVEASVEEAVNSGTWIDVQPLLPSCLSSEDVGILVNEVMRTANVQSSARLLCGTVVVSEKFISSCLTFFEQSMQQKAQKEIKNNPVFLISEDDLKQNPTLADTAPPGKKDRKEERRKKAAEGGGSTKSGGGGNAREIRIRKTKKKGRRDEESDEEVATAPQGRNKQAEVPFMSHEQVEAVLQEQVCDCPEEMISELAGHILRPLTRLYQEVVRAAFLSSSGAGPGAGRKQNVKELQEEISNLYNNIRLFEKGAKLFPDETQASIAKHVLKTVCTDMTNVLLTFAAAEFMSAVESPGSVTSEVRMRILGKLPEDTKGPLMKLHNSLNGRSIEDFLTHLEPSVEVCGFMLKKGDKKRERQALFQHRQALTEQLKQTEDPALVLHLTCVLLFQLSSQCALHAPGRCVPQIISALTGRIPEDQQRLLSQYQALVVKQLVSHSRKLPQGETEGDSGGPHGDDMDAVRKELLSLTNEVKDLVLSPRKTSVTED